MRVTSKGRVTTPQAIREQLGIRPGTEVGFEVGGDAVRIVKIAPSTRGHLLADRLRGSGTGA